MHPSARVSQAIVGVITLAVVLAAGVFVARDVPVRSGEVMHGAAGK